MEWSNEVIMQFLDLYEREPSIWNPQNADHRDRCKVHDAWKRIQGSIGVECSVTELKKKKENLMATYRKLAMKVKKSMQPVHRRVYKPEWFAYEKMGSFLHRIYTPRITKAPDEGLENEQDDPSTDEHPKPEPVECSGTNSVCYDEEIHDTPPTETAVIDEGVPPTSRKRKAENVEKRMCEAFTLLKQVANKPKSVKDESSLFCDLLCLKLKSLDDNTREIAMHEINNLMFNLRSPKTEQLYWSHPGYLSNTPLPRGLPGELLDDGSENSFSGKE